MNTQNPVQASDLAGARVQPESPASGEVEERGNYRRREVYFIQAGEGGLVKIGVADDAKARLAGLAPMCPVPLRVLGIAICERSGALEKFLHIRFGKHRRHGEWFSPAEEILDYADRCLLERPHRVMELQKGLNRPFRSSGRRSRDQTATTHQKQKALTKAFISAAEDRRFYREQAGKQYHDAAAFKVVKGRLVYDGRAPAKPKNLIFSTDWSYEKNAALLEDVFGEPLKGDFAEFVKAHSLPAHPNHPGGMNPWS